MITAYDAYVVTCLQGANTDWSKGHNNSFADNLESKVLSLVIPYFCPKRLMFDNFCYSSSISLVVAVIIIAATIIIYIYHHRRRQYHHQHHIVNDIVAIKSTFLPHSHSLSSDWEYVDVWYVSRGYCHLVFKFYLESPLYSWIFMRTQVKKRRGLTIHIDVCLPRWKITKRLIYSANILQREATTM